MHFPAMAFLRLPFILQAYTEGSAAKEGKRRGLFLTFSKNDSAMKPCNSQTISSAADSRNSSSTLPLQPACGRVTEDCESHNRNTSENIPQWALLFRLPQGSTISSAGIPAGNQRAGPKVERKKRTGETAWKPYFSP